MESKRIKGVDPLAIDKQVLAVVKKYASEWDGGDTYCLAIRNSAGEIYRTIHIDSSGICEHVEGGLHALGLRKEVGGHRLGNRLHTVYVLPGTTASGNAQA